MTAYHFNDGADFDSRCAPRAGGDTPAVSTAYKVTSGGALLRDRYGKGGGGYGSVGPTAKSVFGGTPFNNPSGYDVADYFAAINRNCMGASIPNSVIVGSPSYSVYVSITLLSDGRIRKVAGDSSAPSTTTYPDRWGGINVSGGSFQCRFTLVSGSVSGTFGSWLSLSSGRGVSCNAPAGGTQSGRVKAEWRYGSYGAIFSETFDIGAISGIK